ncbi:MAG: DUF4091 domain-containing protein [Clostridia bacterium]|nr:DUF4091 domain-containing protein [Clostridia bacterium]
MKKTARRFLKSGLIAVLCGAVVLPLVKTSGDRRTEVAAVEGLADVWSTYSTYAVLRDPAELAKNEYQPPKMDAKLSFSMAQGETEGGQILFTAKKDISTFDFKVSELKNGENTISVEDIDVYKQCYTYIRDDRTPMTVGWYPDMLLPMELAKKAKETGVAAGHNQGITIEVTTTSETVPGVYTGTFTLEIEGEKKDIPVSVEVWDIDITASHSYTVEVGMYDKMSMGGDASAESIRKYYDQMIDYRGNIVYMPFSTYSLDRFIEELMIYWDNPRVTYIGIPEEFTVFGQYVLEAARHSTPDMVLTDKLYTYDKANDEQDQYEKVLASMEKFNQQLENAINTLVNENFFVPYDGTPEGGEFYQRLTESIRSVWIIETIGWREEYRDLNITYVPHNEFGSGSTLTGEGGVDYEANRDVYDDQSAEGIYLHYINGTAPWLGHGMPNYLSNFRYWGYNMQAEGMQGFLSWSICEYSLVQAGSANTYVPRNVYEDAFNYSSLKFCLDGQYVYPGGRYGVTGFLPTLRLAVRRDGLEDYELIYKLEQLYSKELMREYGVDYDTRDVLDWVYRKAVSDINYYNCDDTLVFEMRENIVDLIKLAEGDAKFMLSGISFDQDEATVDFIAAEGWDVTFCGNALTGTQSGSGVRYTVKRNVNTGNDITIELKKGDKTYTFEAKMVRNTVNVGGLVENGEIKAGIQAREDAVTAVTGNDVSFTFKKYELEDPEDIIFERDRYFALTDEYFGCPISELYDVTLTFEVDTTEVDTDFEMRMYMCVGGYDTSYLVDAKGLYSNGENKRVYTVTFLVDKLSRKQFAPYQKVDWLVWRLENAEETKNGYRLYEDMTVTLKKVSYTKYGRMGE